MENEIYTIKFQKEGYGEGFFDGQMRDRIKWQDKIKAKIEEFKKVRDTILENEKKLNKTNDIEKIKAINERLIAYQELLMEDYND